MNCFLNYGGHSQIEIIVSILITMLFELVI